MTPNHLPPPLRNNSGAGVMAQVLRAPTALPEELGSITSTHKAAHQPSSSEGDLMPSCWPLWASGMHAYGTCHRHTCSKTPKHKNFNRFLKIQKGKGKQKSPNAELRHNSTNSNKALGPLSGMLPSIVTPLPRD